MIWGEQMPSSSDQRSKDVTSSPEHKMILVVDDDIDVWRILRYALEEEGLDVDCAENGLVALQKLREKSPDLIILDLNMPRMGGEEFLFAWRAGVETGGVPVIVITATSDAFRPSDLGVQAVFAKPFDVNKLVWHVNDLLALPANTPRVRRGGDSLTEMSGIVQDLTQVMSMLLVTVELLADTSNLSDDVRQLTTKSLDAAHRSSALVRRLANLIGPAD